MTHRTRTRRDGWTARRQFDFLEALRRCRSVARAAAFVGMSRESAYRLRTRENEGLFALAWEEALKPKITYLSASHALSSTRRHPQRCQLRDPPVRRVGV